METGYERRQGHDMWRSSSVSDAQQLQDVMTECTSNFTHQMESMEGVASSCGSRPRMPDMPMIAHKAESFSIAVLADRFASMVHLWGQA